MMSGAAVLYRNFTSPPPNAPSSDPRRMSEMLAQARGQARADGFEEGVAQAEARFDQAMVERLEAIAAALADTEALARSAREKAADDACEALRRFIAAIAPQLAAAGAAETAVQTVKRAIAGASGPKPVVETPPAVVDATSAAFSRAGVSCSVRAGEGMVEGEARIVWDAGFDEIDVGPAIREAIAALAPGGGEKIGRDGLPIDAKPEDSPAHEEPEE